MNAIFVFFSLFRVEFFFPPVSFYAIRVPRNIHVATEGVKKTTSLPSKSSLSSSFVAAVSFLSLFLVTPAILYDAFNNTALPRGRSRVQYWEWHNIGSPSDIAKVRGGGERRKGKGKGRRGDETERWDVKRETDRCRAGEIQIFARMPGGSAQRRRSITTFIILTTYVRGLRHLC